MNSVRVDPDAVRAVLSTLAASGRAGKSWRDAYAGGAPMPTQESVLSLVNDVLNTLEGSIAGQAIDDVVSLREDAYENTFSLAVDVLSSEPAVAVAGAALALEAMWERAVDRAELERIATWACAELNRLAPFVLAAIAANDAPTAVEEQGDVGRPTMHVRPVAYQGAPALHIRTDDEHMTEWLWIDLIHRIAEDASRPGQEQLWAGARRDGLELADMSTDIDFRAAVQYPAQLEPADAIARLQDFAPQFDWSTDDADEDVEDVALPMTGAIIVSWTTVSEDIDPDFAYTWQIDAGDLDDPDAVRRALSIAAGTVDA